MTLFQNYDWILSARQKELSEMRDRYKELKESISKSGLALDPEIDKQIEEHLEFEKTFFETDKIKGTP